MRASSATANKAAVAKPAEPRTITDTWPASTLGQAVDAGGKIEFKILRRSVHPMPGTGRPHDDAVPLPRKTLRVFVVSTG